jgi:uncharacterized protein (TIGR03435 family)
MKRVVALAGVTLFASGAFGQASATRPEFDVAVIKQNKSGDSQVQGGVLPGGQFSMRNAPLIALLGFAFNVPNQRFVGSYITGAPSWVNSERFDVTGKGPPDAPVRQCFFSRFCLPDKTLGLMLQTFLEKEFTMADHQEQRPTDVFALTLGKGPLKLQKSAGSGERSCHRFVGASDDPAAKGLSADQAGFACVNTTMAEFAEFLPEMAGAYIDRAVKDQTGLEGSYDFKLAWVSRALIDQGGLDVFGAISGLGLKLEQRKLPMPVVVIDHIEKLADDN